MGIAATGLSRAFGERTVVQDAHVTVAAGTITALVGPNGSGKTTLMLMLATLLCPDAGSIHIAGHDALEDTSAARASLGWMPDALGAWNALTVHETLTATAKLYGLSDAAKRTEDLLTTTGLAPLAGARTHTLSRGQKQRLSLARALVHSPSVLLLDEPASGLDPDARREQREMLLHLAAEGAAILVTSHVLDELEHLVNDVIFLKDGRTSGGAPTAEDALGSGVWRIRSLAPELLETTLTAWGYAWTRHSSVAGTYSIVELADEAQATALLQALVAAGAPIAEFTPATGVIAQGFARLQSSSAGTEES